VSSDLPANYDLDRTRGPGDAPWVKCPECGQPWELCWCEDDDEQREDIDAFA
jgi:hypothetical protein